MRRSASTATARSVSSFSAGSGCASGDLGLRADGGHRGAQLVRRVAGEPLQPRHRVVAPGQQPVELLGQGAHLVAGRRHGQPVARRQRRGRRPQPVDRAQRRPRRHPRRPGDDQRREQRADHREPRRPPHQRRPAHEVGRRHGQPRRAVRGDRRLRDPPARRGEPLGGHALTRGEQGDLRRIERQRRAPVDAPPRRVDDPHPRRVGRPALEPARRPAAPACAAPGPSSRPARRTPAPWRACSARAARRGPPRRRSA